MTDTKTLVQPGADSVTRHRQEELRLWNVVLLDDDMHTYEYVVEMLTTLFHHSVQTAYRSAQRVDESGRAIVLTTHRELAELKQEQIRGFGSDRAVSECTGAMSAIIEPAHEPADA